MQSELIKAMLARQMANNNHPMYSPWEAVGNIALTAALAKRMDKADAKDKKEANNLAGVLAQQIGVPQTQIPMESLTPGGQEPPLSVSSAPVTQSPQYQALSGLPKETLSQVVVQNMLKGKKDPIALSEGQILVDPDTMKPIPGASNPKPPKEDDLPSSAKEYELVVGKKVKDWDESNRRNFFSYIQGKGSTNIKAEFYPNMTGGTATEVQQKIIDLSEQARRLRDIDPAQAAESTTYWGSLKRLTYGVLDKLNATGASEKEWLANDQQFFGAAEETFASLRKTITGAQAVLKELDQLRAATISARGQSPTQFKAALERYLGSTSEAIEMYTGFLQKGMSQAEAENELNKAWLEKNKTKYHDATVEELTNFGTR